MAEVMNQAGNTYPPLNTLKRVCENLWIVDGPIIRFGMPGSKMPFPTRMTVIRSEGNGPARIILAHGRWHERNGTEELRRAFRWILAPARR